ncbi:MAG: chromosomal replication initiation protein DnaA [Betaproteobacteria bacterium TMED22]|nr:MAG: chromosomal replication initiation protein DnaA [Betaproteobacteria bacterium TMED22]
MTSFWDGCLDYFKTVLSSQQYKTWVQPLDGNIINDEIVIVAPNRFLLVWARDNYSKDFKRLCTEATGSNLPIRFSLKTAPHTEKTSNHSKSSYGESDKSQPIKNHIKHSNRLPQLNIGFTFDNFVIGRGNQLARAAALQVCDNPATAYNPLFIYGGGGLGKTHLVQAIGNVIAEKTPDAKILYIHAEKYVSDVVSAYQHKSFENFKRFYHSLDLLLIDDIQFFAKKARTQEEFFYLFNALTQSKKQVVMTCDTFPKEISGMEDRLVSRFGSGLTVAIEPPELELRVAILLKKAEIDSIPLSEDVAFFVATHIQSNVRELEGALKRISAYANFTKELISVSLAKEALKDLLASNSKLITIDSIQKCVADYYKLKVSDMFSKKRIRSVARPRQMAMALSKELTSYSLPDIGDAYGGRDHTTVLHACRKIAELRTSDSNIARDFNALIQILRS